MPSQLNKPPSDDAGGGEKKKPRKPYSTKRTRALEDEVQKEKDQVAMLIRHNADLEAQAQMARNVVNDLTREKVHLQEENERLAQENERLSGDNGRLGRDNVDLRNQADLAKSTCKDVARKNTRLQEEAKELKLASGVADARVRALQARLDAAAARDVVVARLARQLLEQFDRPKGSPADCAVKKEDEVKQEIKEEEERGGRGGGGKRQKIKLGELVKPVPL